MLIIRRNITKIIRVFLKNRILSFTVFGIFTFLIGSNLLLGRGKLSGLAPASQLLQYTGPFFAEVDLIQLKIHDFVSNASENKTNIPVTPKADKTLPSGYEIASQMGPICDQLIRSHDVRNDTGDVTVKWSKNNDLMFCPTYKVGSTFWSLLFMLHNDKKYSRVDNPYDLPYIQYPGSRKPATILNNQNNFKVLFARDPYKRLFSAYVDKVYLPNSYFKKTLATPISKYTRPNANKASHTCANDITFPEFIKYVIHALETSARVIIEPHIVPVSINCLSCKMHYDFIGKMENIKTDAQIVIEKLNLTGVTDLLNRNGSILATESEIKDTINRPFTYKKDFSRCMSFIESMRKCWTVLQLKGLIGNDTIGELSAASKLKDLQTRAMESLKNSSRKNRSLFKTNEYEKHWSHVELSDKLKIRALYKADFKLFQYDDSPSYLFNRNIDGLSFS